MSFIIIVLATANVILVMSETDYCQLCLGHVSCNATIKFYPNCEDAKMVILKKCWILLKHNVWRNAVAGGKERNLKPACRMSYMQWDEELAELAAYNVAQCKVNRDKCVKSVRFPRVAQNLGSTNYSGNRPNAKMLTQDIITNWYKEINNVRRSDIDVIRANDSNKTTKFTTMMEDGATSIGCAAASYKDGGKQVFLLACNYGSTNLVGKPVYETCNEPGQKCGHNSLQFQNLCRRDEKSKEFKSLRKPKLLNIRYKPIFNTWNGFNPYFRPYPVQEPWDILKSVPNYQPNNFSLANVNHNFNNMQNNQGNINYNQHYNINSDFLGDFLKNPKFKTTT